MCLVGKFKKRNKELPNERLEGSWGDLWLGIRTFFAVGLQAVTLGLLEVYAGDFGSLLGQF